MSDRAEEDASVPSEAEVEEDARFKDALLRYHSLNFESQTLGNLCLNVIIDNPSFFSKKIEPFNNLPAPILNLIADKIEEKQNGVSLFLPLLVTENSRSLRIPDNRDFFFQEKFYQAPSTLIYDLIVQKCQLKLTSLTIYHDRFSGTDAGEEAVAGISPTQLHALLGTLVNLKTLDLSNLNVTDVTLQVIKISCKHLRCLDVAQNQGVTDNGLNILFDPQDCCKSLSHLNVTATSVTVAGLQEVLKHRHIRALLHKNIHSALIANLELWNNLNPALTSFETQAVLTPYEQRHITYVFNNLPNLSFILVNKLSYLVEINPRSELSWLEVECMDLEFEAFDRFMTYTMAPSSISSLTHVVLAKASFAIDISVFGLCSKLQHLELESRILPQPAHEITTSSFKHLRVLKIRFLYFAAPNDHLGPVQLPEPLLLQLFSSDMLQTLYLQLITFPQQLLCQQIVKANADEHNMFLQLNDFVILDNYYTLESIMEVICLAPNLDRMLITLTPAQFVQLKKFVKRNKLKFNVRTTQ